MAIHLIETLNILSLPSPGIVTSKSTCKKGNERAMSHERLPMGGLDTELTVQRKCHIVEKAALQVPAVTNYGMAAIEVFVQLWSHHLTSKELEHLL